MGRRQDFTGFFNGLAFSIITTLDLDYHVVTVQLNPMQLVLVGTTLELSVFLFEVPTGVVADLFSRRTSTIIGMILTGVAFCVEGSLPYFAALLVAQVLWGLGFTFTSGAHDAWIADEIGAENAAPVYVRAGQLFQVGMLCGIPFSVLLGGRGLNVPVLAGGILYLLLGALLWLFMPEDGFTPALQTTSQGVAHTLSHSWKTARNTLRDGTHLVRSRPVLLAFLSIAALVGLSSEGYDRLWAAHILQDFTFPEFPALSREMWFGVLRAGSMLLAVGASAWIRHKYDTKDATLVVRVLSVTAVLLAIAMFTLALTGSFLLAILAYWVIEMTRRVAEPLNTAWLNKHIASNVRATVLSITSQVDALGQIVGGPIVGAVGTLVSLRAALVCVALLLTPMPAQYEYIRRLMAKHSEV